MFTSILEEYIASISKVGVRLFGEGVQKSKWGNMKEERKKGNEKASVEL
jgi:hypothetical protein